MGTYENFNYPRNTRKGNIFLLYFATKVRNKTLKASLSLLKKVNLV